MPVNVINPEAAVLQQTTEYWQQLATLIVWKCARNGVSITAKDMARYQKEFDGPGAVLFTHGEKDRITFSIVTKERATELAEHDAKGHGHA